MCFARLNPSVTAKPCHLPLGKGGFMVRKITKVLTDKGDFFVNGKKKSQKTRREVLKMRVAVPHPFREATNVKRYTLSARVINNAITEKSPKS